MELDAKSDVRRTVNLVGDAWVGTSEVEASEFFERNSPIIGDKNYDFGFKVNESMVLCKLLPNALYNNIGITLTIPTSTSRDDVRNDVEQLLELVETKAKYMQYHCLSLLDIGDAQLLRWYESHGFVLEMSQPLNALVALRNYDSYVYCMRKRLV